MKTISIIAEYNPFHNGHAWQIAEAKRRTGADFALIVMSGDFVQRGEPAVLDKFSRTRMALLGGADLVLELPVRYAAGSAEYFARGACSLLASLNVTDTLCFGCETEDPAAFSALSSLLADEPEAFRRYLRSYLAAGNSYPKARLLALESCFFPGSSQSSPGYDSHFASDADPLSPPGNPFSFKTATELLSFPNNTLGLEYLIACRRLKASFDFLPVKRQGASYHSSLPQGNFASATAIRKNPALACGYMPDVCQELYEHAVSGQMLHSIDDYSDLLHYALLMQKDYTAFRKCRPLGPHPQTAATVQVFFFVCKPVKNKTGHRGTHPPQSAAYSAWYSKKRTVGRSFCRSFLCKSSRLSPECIAAFQGDQKKKLHPTADKSRRCEKASFTIRTG